QQVRLRISQPGLAPNPSRFFFHLLSPRTGLRHNHWRRPLDHGMKRQSPRGYLATACQRVFDGLVRLAVRLGLSRASRHFALRRRSLMLWWAYFPSATARGTAP